MCDPALSSEATTRMVDTVAPPFRRITLALVAMVALPVSSYVTGSTVGAFRMFTDLVRYRLQIDAVDAGGAVHPVAPESLARHLGRDARRIIVPAGKPIYGETAASLLASGLPDLGRLVCRLTPSARVVHVTLERDAVDGPLPPLKRDVTCGG